MQTIRLGTRGSQLALYQANVTRQLLKAQAGVDSEIVVIKTSGDRLAEAPLSDIGGKRLFVKEIEDALLEGSIDVAVHSSKDCRCCCLRARGCSGARARGRTRCGGAGGRRRAGVSLRRGAGGASRPVRARRDEQRSPQCADQPGHPHCALPSHPRQPRHTATEAGRRRVRRACPCRSRSEAARPGGPDFRHASGCCLCSGAGQGIIALEVRQDDTRVRELAQRINDGRAAAALAAERALVRRLEGGCQMPIGAYAAVDHSRLELHAIVISLDGAQAVRADAAGPLDDAEALGIRVAEQLLADGAANILAEVHRAHAGVKGLQP